MNADIAKALSILVPGMGQVYVHKTKEGVVLFASSLVFLFIGELGFIRMFEPKYFAMDYYQDAYQPYGYEINFAFMGVAIIGFALAIIFWYISYKNIKKFVETV